MLIVYNPQWKKAKTKLDYLFWCFCSFVLHRSKARGNIIYLAGNIGHFVFFVKKLGLQKTAVVRDLSNGQCQSYIHIQPLRIWVMLLCLGFGYQHLLSVSVSVVMAGMDYKSPTCLQWKIQPIRLQFTMLIKIGKSQHFVCCVFTL